MLLLPRGQLISFTGVEPEISHFSTQFYLTTFYLAFTLASLQSLVFFKPVVLQLLMIFYHQQICTLLQEGEATESAVT